MIEETTYYEVVCDRCGCTLDVDEQTAWRTEREARKVMKRYGWAELKSGHTYCSGCIDSDEVMLSDSDINPFADE